MHMSALLLRIGDDLLTYESRETYTLDTDAVLMTGLPMNLVEGT